MFNDGLYLIHYVVILNSLNIYKYLLEKYKNDKEKLMQKNESRLIKF